VYFNLQAGRALPNPTSVMALERVAGSRELGPPSRPGMM
jgi:hypothetical protein